MKTRTKKWLAGAVLAGLSITTATRFLGTDPKAEPDFAILATTPGVGFQSAMVGWNELGWAEPAVWKAAGVATRSGGGVARVWIQYAIQDLNQSHFVAGLAARDAGLRVHLSATGAPENRNAPGKEERPNAWPPADPEAWGMRVAADIRKLRAQGVPVTSVSIWAEPDLADSGKHWNGTREAFVDFYARAGAVLTAELPEDVLVGGPDLARGHGPGLVLLADLVRAARAHGWTPRVVAHHQYGCYPNDPEAFHLPDRIRELFAEAGAAAPPEILLSEWAVGLPGQTGQELALDDHRGAVYVLAVELAAARAGYTGCCYFFLQDTGIEARGHDFYGLNGLFTVHGAPKASLGALAVAGELSTWPSLAVDRRAAHWNLSAWAGRKEDRGLLLVAHVLGDEQERARKAMDLAGLTDLSSLPKALEGPLTAFLDGDLDFAALGLPESYELPLLAGQASKAAGRAERRLQDRREVSFAISGARPQVVDVELLGPGAGVPQLDPAYLAEFSDLPPLGDPDRTAAVVDLAMHPALRPQRVTAGDWAHWDGERLLVRCPRDHAVLILLSWGHAE